MSMYSNIKLLWININISHNFDVVNKNLMYNVNMNRKFSIRIKKLREERELSQAKLALGLGTFQQTVDRWEKNKIEPDIEMILKIAIFFNVSTDYLLGLTDDMYK